ncbi:ricin-type beta-trefoil lectin domain protein [Streptomyces sp. AV19]|uniref:RICIN domain-containing protein n=1 Tax=Streptomyces sp. AV19 TaxID=2793068 RepID=UPI0018FE4A75|nr:RICIN domain-containing protein [Streptomyces sp. AV19]MBH1936707.1 ricin-type beta-trefoil lectin domain protein [Streptomyces sp. AV19]MDG4532766.1 ricin-type beta-trefoil lectin domain protein [Streptomyces sp. AV19]
MRAMKRIALATVAAGLAAGAFTATAGPAIAATQAEGFKASVQSYRDDTNLDEYYGRERGAQVLTRDAREYYQNFKFERVGSTPGTYTIKGERFGLCLTAQGLDRPIVQQACDSGKLSQRWQVDTVNQPSVIKSIKYTNQVIQANGLDRAVTLEHVQAGKTNQLWTLYTKD